MASRGHAASAKRVATPAATPAVLPAGRSPRARARQGRLDDDLAEALRRETARLAAIEDPEERVRAVNDFFAAMDHHVLAVGDIRAAALVQLHASWGYDRLARLSGLSKSRVAQIIRSRRS